MQTSELMKTNDMITEVRKVKWDELWHIVYILPNGKETYNRVDKKTALFVALKRLND